jgi:hypothetical protein
MARYCLCSKSSRAIFALSKIESRSCRQVNLLRYLNGTADKGMMFSPNDYLCVDCYTNADFAGLWGIEHDQDAVLVKSKTGHLIMFIGCPVLWVSQLQTQISLRTMESEYIALIALSQSMRDLIGI